MLAGLTWNLLSRSVIGSFHLMSCPERRSRCSLLRKSTLDWLVCTSGVGTGGLKAMNFLDEHISFPIINVVQIASRCRAYGMLWKVQFLQTSKLANLKDYHENRVPKNANYEYFNKREILTYLFHKLWLVTLKRDKTLCLIMKVVIIILSYLDF